MITWVFNVVLCCLCVRYSIGEVGVNLRAQAGRISASATTRKIVLYPNTGVVLSPTYAAEVSDALVDVLAGAGDMSRKLTLLIKKCIVTEKGPSKCQTIQIYTTAKEVKVGVFYSYDVFCMDDHEYSVTLSFSMTAPETAPHSEVHDFYDRALLAFSDSAICNTDRPRVKSSSSNHPQTSMSMFDDELDYDVIHLHGPDTRSQGFRNVGSSHFVSSAGDINGDGYDDVIVDNADVVKDSVLAYVVFGQQWTVWDNYLKELNYSQGFPIYYHSSIISTHFAYGANINGDRFEDMLISVSYNDSGIIIQELFVIYGSRQISTLNLTSLTAAQGVRITYNSTLNDRFGESLDGAGDVNGDGFDDIIVSARRWNNKQGNVYLIYGNASMIDMTITPNTTLANGVVFCGESMLDVFGSGVGAGGDINGDGFADFMIGAYNWSESYGRAYAVFGGDSMPRYVRIQDLQSLNMGFSLSGEVPGDSAGWVARGIGDINDDGISDIAVSAPDANLGTGYVGVLYGRSDGDFFSDYVLTSIESPQGFLVFGTYTLASLGFDITVVNDMNGDSIDDFAISAPFAYVTRGAVYIIYGSTGYSGNYYLSTLSPSFGSEVIGDTKGVYGGLLGYTLCGVGDFNRDGVFDLIMAQPQINDSVVYLGSASGLSDLDLSSWASIINAFTGGDVYDRAGYEVSYALDVNNDSYADFLVGAYQASPNGRYRAGNTYLIYGSEEPVNLNLKTLVPSRGSIVYGTEAGDNCGKTVMSGDINGDGNSDIIVGCINSGIIYVLYGNGAKFPATIDLAAWNSSLGIKLVGKGADQSGYVVLTDDYNHDGIMDLYISAPFADPKGRSNAGIVYILWGGVSYSYLNLTSNFNSTYGMKIIGGVAGDRIGCCKYFSVGDFNGDGYEDIGISSSERSSAKGIVYIIFGNDALPSYIDLAYFNSSLGIKLTGPQKGSYFGYAMAGVGDFNRDGYDDVLIGAYGYDSLVDADVGACYLIYGTSSPADIDAATLTRSQGFVLYGDKFSDRVGSAVSPAGDVNNDQYFDFIIGANGYDGNRGAAFVIFGQAALVADPYYLAPSSLKNTQGYTVLGAAQGDRTAFYLSPAGDVDNNGVSDYLIGAYSANSEKGITYLIRALPDPTSPPTSYPTSRPSDKPIPGETKASFFDVYGGLILATALPTMALTTPLVFSQSICFYVLEHWGSIVAGMDEMHKAHRGPVKRFIYTTCKRVFLQTFLDSVEAKKKKHELDREKLLDKMKEASTDGLEMPTLVFNRDMSMDSSHNPLISNPSTAFSRYKDVEESKDDAGGLSSSTSEGQSSQTHTSGRVSPLPITSNGRLSGEVHTDIVAKAVFRIEYDNAFINGIMNMPLKARHRHQQSLPPSQVPSTESSLPKYDGLLLDYADFLSLALSVFPDCIFFYHSLSRSLTDELCYNTAFPEAIVYTFCVVLFVVVQLFRAYRLWIAAGKGNYKLNWTSLSFVSLMSASCYACRLLPFLVHSPHLQVLCFVVPLLIKAVARIVLAMPTDVDPLKVVHEYLFVVHLALRSSGSAFLLGIFRCCFLFSSVYCYFAVPSKVSGFWSVLDDVKPRFKHYSRLYFAYFAIHLVFAFAHVVILIAHA